MLCQCCDFSSFWSRWNSTKTRCHFVLVVNIHIDDLRCVKSFFYQQLEGFSHEFSCSIDLRIRAPFISGLGSTAWMKLMAKDSAFVQQYPPAVTRFLIIFVDWFVHVRFKAFVQFHRWESNKTHAVLYYVSLSTTCCATTQPVLLQQSIGAVLQMKWPRYKPGRAMYYAVDVLGWVKETFATSRWSVKLLATSWISGTAVTRLKMTTSN